MGCCGEGKVVSVGVAFWVGSQAREFVLLKVGDGEEGGGRRFYYK